ncbi:MAG TPA: hypothetical protein PKD90_06645, partial [Phnomibacter sp.]|nr:hypothetical protein [Phnomibacter sp.]
FIVNIAWKNGKLANATLQSLNGKNCTIRTTTPVTINGQKLKAIVSKGQYITSFTTKANLVYTIKAM